MNHNDTFLHSLTTRTVALFLAMAVGPMSAHCYAQTVVTTPFRSGPPLGDSVTVVDVPANPGQPISTSERNAENNTDNGETNNRSAVQSPTPNKGGFLGAHRDDVRDAGLVIGVGAAAVGLFQALKHFLDN